MWRDLSTAPSGTAVRLLVSDAIDDCGHGTNEYEITARQEDGRWYKLGSMKAISFPLFWLPTKSAGGVSKDGVGINYFGPREDWSSI
jgi:hypothetical protein